MLITCAGGKFTWAGRSKNSACDAGSGEKYLSTSSKLVSDEEACKKSCEDAAACKSITFYSSGWCSHFSTECTKTKADGNAISIRLSRAATTTASPAGRLICWKIRWGPGHEITFAFPKCQCESPHQQLGVRATYDC